MSSSTPIRTPLPRVRIYLPTYRRPKLLPRALASLLAQTVADWVCEVHNDAPEDPEPGRLVAELADPRITLVNHPRNLGGTATFNLFFKPRSEPFGSILEDDNWWEPHFLETMLATAEANPKITIFWSNMRLWQEEADGTFRDTGRFIWPDLEENQRPFFWGQPQQIWGALHSNGAALIRSQASSDFQTPEVPIAVIEPFRERLFPHPILLIPEPLAHFSHTLHSARSNDRSEWALLQAMLAATFLKHADYDRPQRESLWKRSRTERPPTTTVLLLASFLDESLQPFRAHAEWADWLRLTRGVLRSPRTLLRVLRARRQHADWWKWLDRHTAERFAESRSAGV